MGNKKNKFQFLKTEITICPKVLKENWQMLPLLKTIKIDSLLNLDLKPWSSVRESVNTNFFKINSWLLNRTSTESPMRKEGWKMTTKVELKSMSIWSQPSDKKLMIRRISWSTERSRMLISTPSLIPRRIFSTLDTQKLLDLEATLLNIKILALNSNLKRSTWSKNFLIWEKETVRTLKKLINSTIKMN